MPRLESPSATDFQTFDKLNMLSWERTAPLPIPYVRAKPIWLTDSGGVTQQFAHAGRAIMRGPRPGIAAFDYSTLRQDLAHVEVLLPPDAPAMYLNPAALSYALDVKEIQKVWTPLSEREPLPRRLSRSLCVRSIAR